MFIRGLTFLLSICGAVGAAQAELVWQQTSQSRNVDVRQADTTFEFQFRNTGNELISILETKSSCSCFLPKLEKTEYAPGESGILKVEAHLNGREGRINKSIEVTTSDHPNKPHKLSIDVRIPQGYKLSSRRLLWKEGDKGSKTCTLTNPSKTPIKLASASSSSSAFEVELKEIRPGFEYRLHVLPRNGSSQVRAVITISTEQVGDSPPRTYKVYGLRS